jgi:hypothetical protein
MVRLVKTVLVSTAVALIAPAAASADSGSISAAQDLGDGRIQTTISVTSTTCSGIGFCGWLGYSLERHSSLECRDDLTFLRSVVPFHETSGTAQQTVTFRPFFPRQTKLCVILDNEAGINVVAERVFDLPSGYGVQRSTGFNCSSFGSQAAAQYYLMLYPGDPSNLDGDNDGAACEENDCPCGAESIPPEPLPEPPPLLEPPPPGGPPGPPPPPIPEFDVSAKNKQKVGKPKLNVGCPDRDCTVNVSGKAKVPRGVLRKTKRYPLQPQTVELPAGATQTLGLKYRSHRRSARKIRKLMKKEKTGAKLNVHVTATGDGGTVKDDEKIKLKR